MKRDLARIYVESGRGEDAIALLRAGPVEDAESLEVLGVALAAAGKNDEAKGDPASRLGRRSGDARMPSISAHSPFID